MGRNQRQLAHDICEELGLPQRVGEAFMERLLELIGDDLVATRRVELRGLGIFTVRHRPEKHTLHPKTHQPITIRARETVEYRSSVALRRRLNPEKTD